MKTLMMYNQFEETSTAPAVFFVELDGDYSHLDQTFVNSTGDKALQKELLALIYDDKLEAFKVPLLVKPTKTWDKFISCGFYL